MSSQFVTYALIGIGLGAMYSLAAQGLIVIYRGSGVLNFAHGAIGTVGAYTFYELHVVRGYSNWISLPLGVAVCAVIGMLSHVLIMRNLRGASPLVRVIATLGLLVTLESAVVLRYGGRPTFVPSSLPTGTIHLYGKVTVTDDRLALVVIAVAITAALYAFYRFTGFGRGTTAVAENEIAAAALGWNPDLIAAVNWAIGSAMAGLAAILISPIVTLQASVMTNLVLAALATALVASFRSFPVALIAGLVIGIAQTEVQIYEANVVGLSTSLPFLLIVVLLLFRGQSLPLRDFLLQRLPSLGTGRIRPLPAAAAVVASLAIILAASASWIAGLTILLGFALILLSVVVVTGYAGQLSLAQFAVAGVGAWIAGRVDDALNVPFWASFLIGVLAAMVAGMVMALPAVRTRGITLAVVTLGLGQAVEYMVFDNGSLTGGIAGTQVGTPNIFGIDIGPISHPTRYAVFGLAVFVIGIIAVANLRRSRSGRRMIAVRTNERAAAALGINVPLVKIYAFGIAGAIAAAGGIILAFQTPNISYSTLFPNFTSIQAVGWATIGGIGYILGPVSGATLAPGSAGMVFFSTYLGGVAKYVPLIGGISIILLVLQNQNGVIREVANQINWVANKVGRGRLASKPRVSQHHEVIAAEGDTIVRVKPRVLNVENLNVQYGAVTAVANLSFTVNPGQVVGLIGPNGAGKTSVIDAITGFAGGPDSALTLDGVRIEKWRAARRARAGLSRSFQSLELFEDSTVLDNLLTASDPASPLSYIRDPFFPTPDVLGSEVVAALREFGFEELVDKVAQELSYAQRRLLAIARAVASRPSVLLLDEPAAGLGDVETAEAAELVRRLADEWGMGVLVIEHDMNFVMSICDHIVVLDFGQKIAEGNPEQIQSDPIVLSAYLGELEESEPAVDAMRLDDAQAKDAVQN
jgi:ABC-type branched-subunit amino acid transport system ATPase component/ABC-type branched-subunit amino acid transport system permease subunit